MSMNVGIDIDEDRTNNIFQDLLNEACLGYKTNHACKYDCVLHWNEFDDLQYCPTCSEARNKEGSVHMRWHRDKHVETDGVLRHPVDAERENQGYHECSVGPTRFEDKKGLTSLDVGNRLVKPHTSYKFHTVELDFRRTTQNSGVMVIGESDASGSGDNNFYGVLDEVLHIQYPLGRNVCYLSIGGIMSSTYPRHNFLEMDAMFLEFEDELDNLAGGSSSVGDNAIHRRISMKIAPGAEKPISPHVVRITARRYACAYKKYFPSAALSGRTLAQNTLRTSRATSRVVKHQMLNTFKEFQDNCHRHFKKYSDPEEARTNLPNILEQSWTNKVARQKKPYNHTSESKSFLQRQHELAEKKGESVDRCGVVLRNTRSSRDVRVAGRRNQMLELQFQPTLEGSQPLSGDEID
ncbi:CACTA en-spm transposon protein [Cucumis melo var. makuwa]|uniref:CACTA en-spm transposon protein n=1 Tax=Cucumis melo var. makuwa TaxID=1194695 RepID=A0A5D3BCM7_CUCMM|nr:CACTA en-spm transposon protein [Cucumis melo var. makuwa]TYJ96706.1 CACTA en-spm transposon protein [Cucumis melo var. makuwa]